LPDDLLAIGLCLKSRTSFRHPDFIAGTTVPRPGGAEPMSRDPNFDMVADCGDSRQSDHQSRDHVRAGRIIHSVFSSSGY